MRCRLCPKKPSATTLSSGIGRRWPPLPIEPPPLRARSSPNFRLRRGVMPGVFRHLSAPSQCLVSEHLRPGSRPCSLKERLWVRTWSRRFEDLTRQVPSRCSRTSRYGRASFWSTRSQALSSGSHRVLAVLDSSDFSNLSSRGPHAGPRSVEVNFSSGVDFIGDMSGEPFGSRRAGARENTVNSAKSQLNRPASARRAHECSPPLRV
mmetsp:Transcript_77863/g.152831  ORF Transcript_77863/g.152831 Transcript_77863/m.152831 type:complete len:207 (-) Transcript_77863:23-643(-)